jgi:hypothetical protein
LRRTGSPLLLSFFLTASLASAAWAQDTSSGTSSTTPATPASTTPGQNPATPSATPATDPATPAGAPAPTPAPTPQIVTNTPLPTPTSPLALHVGDTDITIGGFMDAMVVTRSTATGAGLGSSFGTIPFSNTPTGELSETRLSAQNSRVTLGAVSKAGDWNVHGYLEADFLGAGPTNQFVTSNGATLRMRLYWVDASSGKFEFLAGQSWSLLTPGRNGISPNPGDIFYSQDIDTNYQMGLTWGRTEQFRFVFHPSKVVAAGFSLENPEQYVGSSVNLPAAFTATEVDAGANTATPNLYPDIIGKIAIDPQTGNTHQHFEVAGLVSGYKTVDTSASPNTFTATGKGGSVAVNVEPVKNFHIIGTGFFSTGGGRYIANTNIPDFIVNANSSISLVKSNSWIGGFEEQAMPKTQLYVYYSEANATAATATDTNGKTIGFGAGTALQSGDNQKLSEATVGITQIFFRDPKIGGMQMMIQYSYVKRTPFGVSAGAPTFAKANMVYVDVRYILP